jgi:hypothetical protein
LYTDTGIQAYRMLTTFNDDTSDGQFIFKEAEFEDDGFNAALFVTKYRYTVGSRQ